MAKIVTLGEIMLRLSPEGNDRFIQSESLLSSLSTRSVRLLSTVSVVTALTQSSSLVVATA